MRLTLILLSSFVLFGQQSYVARQVLRGPVDPTVCAEAAVFYNTTTHVLKTCTAANTWTATSTSGGSVGGAAALTTVNAIPKVTAAGVLGESTISDNGKNILFARSARITATASYMLTGTADPTASTTLVGTNTLFLTELTVGDRITVNAETRTVTAIATDLSLTVDTAFTDTAAATVTRLPAIMVWRNSAGTVTGMMNDLGYVGIGTVVPSRLFHVSLTDAVTNAVSYVQRLTHETSGTAAASFGLGQEVELENASGTNRVAATTETTWETATDAAEVSNWTLKTMTAGALQTSGLITLSKTYWGLQAGFANTGANPTMVGVYAGLSNTGASSSMFGVSAGQSNTGAYPSMFGYNAGVYNTGDNPSMFGYRAGQSNTGASPSMFGYNAGVYNTGAYPSMFGVDAGYSNTGASPSMFGYNAGVYNTGDNPSMFGYQRGFQNNWDNLTLLGARTSTTFAADSTTDKTFTDTEITANTITFTGAHGFGTGKKNLLFTTIAGTPPTGLVTATVYLFTITNATTVTLSGIGTDASLDFEGKLTNSVDVHASVAIGVDAAPTKAHQVMLGPADITETVLRGNIIGSPGGTVPAWAKYSLVAIANGVNGCANANGCWQVNGVLGANKAAGLTQDVVLTALPAKAQVSDWRIKTALVFTGATTAMTGLGTTASNVLFRAQTYNLAAAVSDTNLSTGPTAGAGANTAAATNLVASLITTVDNIDQIAVNSAVDFWVLYGVLP